MSQPEALYVHVPFCTKICPYCAFNVTSSFDDRIVDRYLDTIDTELSHLANGGSLRLRTVYVGGGTPALLSSRQLERLLVAVTSRVDASFMAEWTVESNPETMDSERARVLRAHGVTRVSVGAQSFDRRHLARLGRTHGVDDIHRAVAVLREAGFEDLNVDLIYGLPQQTLDQWRADLDAVVALDVGHVSLYELTPEPGTPFGRGFARGAIAKADDELSAAMFREAQARLTRARIEWYEVSNFARPGRESLHNQVYWRNEPYFGVGPGAYGCSGPVRTMNAPGLEEWQRLVETTGSGVATRDELSAANTFVETLASGLRTRDGVDLAVLERRTGIDARIAHRRVIDDLAAAGLAGFDGERLVLTLDGVLVLDSILERFLD